MIRTIHFAIGLLAFSATVQAAPRTDLNVPGDYPTIQAAIDAAAPADQIIVAPGTYLETIDLLGKAITVISTNPDDPAIVQSTIIDGNGTGPVVTCASGEGPGTVLSGFTITGGVVPDYGGGMYNLSSSPTVSKCTFTGNSAGINGGGMANRVGSNPSVTDCTFLSNSAAIISLDPPDDNMGHGGGMYNDQSSPEVINCTFMLNDTEMAGGGMANYSSSPSVSGCMFQENTAGDNGAGMASLKFSTPTINDCTFMMNSVNLGGTSSYYNTHSNGGGMFLLESDATVTNCVFIQNYANMDGGGIGVHTCSPTITGCIFDSNHADDDGGGLNNIASSPTISDCSFNANSGVEGGGGVANFLDSSPIIRNCKFTNNTGVDFGGGMMNYGAGTPQIVNCTFIGNHANFRGGGIFNQVNSPVVTNCTFHGNVADSNGGGIASSQFADPVVTNSIIWGNTPNQVHNTSGLWTFDHCNIQGGLVEGTNITDSDPLFLDILSDDLRLSSGSVCIDQGDDATPGLSGVTTDHDNNLRFRNAAVDLGAFETNYCPADADGSGSVDVVDLLDLLGAWGACGLPCPSDIEGDGMVSITDLLTLLGDWGVCP